MELPDLKIPFIFSLIGPRGSGKSTLVKRFLNEQFIYKFQYIAILSPSLHLNTDFDFMEDYSNVYLFHNNFKSVINEIINTMENYKTKDKSSKIQTLIILDDCLTENNVLRFKGLELLATRGRHMNISIVVTSQILKCISNKIRENSDYILSFGSNSYSELEKFLGENFSKLDLKNIRLKLKEIFSQKYNFIFIDNHQQLDDKMFEGFHNHIKFND